MTCSPDVQTSGKSRPATVAARSPETSCSCVSVPSAKKVSISVSSASATISISCSRAIFASSASAAGTSPSVILPLPSAANVSAFMRTRSTTPVKFRSSPIGSWIGTISRAQSRCSDSQRALEARAVALEPVDGDDPRQVERRRLGPQLLGLDFDAGDGVHHDQGALDDAEGRAGVGQEVGEAGGVDEVDLGFLPLGVGQAGREGVLAGDGFFVKIGDGGALVHLAEAVDRAGGEQHGGDELGLAASAVADHRHVADACSVVDLHTG